MIQVALCYIAVFAFAACATCCLEGPREKYDLSERSKYCGARLVDIKNQNQIKYVELYMAAEQGSIKEHFDGTNKSWEEFEFDTVNTTTYKCMTGKSDHERDAAAAVLQVLVQCKTATIDEARAMPSAGADATAQMKCKAACDFLFTMLAMLTVGRAKQIIKECSITRNGAEAWVKLRERFGKTTGATSYAEIFKYN